MESLSNEKHSIHSREHARFSSYRDLDLVYEGMGEKITVRPPDLSTKGMFINVARHFPEGAVIKVAFRLSRSGREVNARAEVRYCLAGVGIGVEFVEISPEDQLAIEEDLGG